MKTGTAAARRCPLPQRRPTVVTGVLLARQRRDDVALETPVSSNAGTTSGIFKILLG
jgi:hypothetical protein